MLSMVVLWDASGQVVGTLDHLVIRDADGRVIGLVDFEAHELAGGRMRDVVEDPGAIGAGTWPEWLGDRARDFSVELDPAPGKARSRIRALIHSSGHRRERAAIDAAIGQRVAAKIDEARERGVDPDPADIRDLVGGPDRPMLLDGRGRTMRRPRIDPIELPVIVPAALRGRAIITPSKGIGPEGEKA